MNSVYSFITSDKDYFTFADSGISDVKRNKKEIKYYNFTSQPVLVVDRSGYRFVVDPEYKNRLACSNQIFMVRIIHSVDSSMIDTIRTFLTRKDSLGQMTKELQVFLRSFNIETDRTHRESSSAFAQKNTKFKPAEILIEVGHFVTESQLHKEKVLYVNDCDAVLTYDLDNKILEHPFSDVNMSRERYVAATKLAYKFGILIDVVDNHQRSNEYFIFTAGGVRQIQSLRDPLRPDGVYVSEVYQEQTHGSDFREIGNCTLEEAGEVFGVYTNRIDAETSGNPKLQLDRKITENKLEATENERILKKMIHDMEREKNEKEKEALDRRLEFEREKYNWERDNAVTAAQYELQLQRVKQSETRVKTVSSIIVAGITITAALLKFLS